jgi:COP9 signalosome complex subunit 5
MPRIKIPGHFVICCFLHVLTVRLRFDAEEQHMIRNVKPWEKDAQYFKVCPFFALAPYKIDFAFKDVKISALALLKMVMHARSGGNIEVMGLMQGKVDANTLIVMDSFALPVEGFD